jgi:hypothetical protein
MSMTIDHALEPADLRHQSLLISAAMAREKPAADLTEREKVALVWVTGGVLQQRWEGGKLTLTTGPAGFYNDAEGKVVVVHGPRGA